LENSPHHAIRVAPEEPLSERHGATSVNWYLLLFVVIVTLFAVYWGFVEPTSRQLAKMRRYVTSLEKSIANLNGHQETTAQTVSLLDQLERQAIVTRDAQAALDEMRMLHSQIVQEASQLRSARQALEKLAELRSDLARQVSLVEATDRALNAVSETHYRVCQAVDDAAAVELSVTQLNRLQSGLAASIRKMEDAQPVLNQIDALHSRLTSAADRTRQARFVSEGLLALEEDLLSRGSHTAAAHLALDDLIDLRDRVDAQATHLDKSEATLAQLVQLQDGVLAQSESVVTAIETLEASHDVQQLLVRAEQTFSNVRRLLTETIMIEPAVQQAMRGLEPLKELADLRRLNVRELRQVVGLIWDRREALAESQDHVGEPSEVVANAATKVAN
jgi:hypothetical protein